MLFLLGRNGVIMNNIQKYFLEALKASLENKKVEWEQEMTSEEWRMLFQMAEIHHVLPMIYDAVYACASIQYCDENVFASCKYKMKQQVLGQIMKTSEFLRLYHMLNKQQSLCMLFNSLFAECRLHKYKWSHKKLGENPCNT